jgi:hypothetical protein
MDEKLVDYLNTQEYIKFLITREELTTGKTKRYFDLLHYVGENSEFAKKFCGKFTLYFADYTEQEIWQEPLIKAFVKELNASFPYIFYLAEKEMGTLKLLTILECANGKSSGENLSMDKIRFEQYLKEQLVGVIKMSQKAGLSPENAQSIVQQIYEYFGI